MHMHQLQQVVFACIITKKKKMFVSLDGDYCQHWQLRKSWEEMACMLLLMYNYRW
jgi:hypothetical protein